MQSAKRNYDAVPTVRPAEPPRSTPVGEPVPARVDADRSLPIDRAVVIPYVGDQLPVVEQLLDRVRAVRVRGESMRTLVFAAASPRTNPNALVDELAAAAERAGFRASVAQLTCTAGRGWLSERGRSRAAEDGRNATAISLNSASLALEVNEWRERHAADDLSLIAGPPLALAAESALVASVCDGLIIVAETGVTERAALRQAAERARLVGCSFVGVLVSRGPRSPSVLGRLVARVRRLLGR